MEGSNFVKTHQECPCGDSSDAYSINRDDSGYCFSCSKYFPSPNKKETMELRPNEQFKFYPHRGLSEGTLRFYDIQTKFRDGEPIETGFPYRPGAFKVRGFNDKVFTSIGDMKTPGLFGKNKFDPGSKESITICEGEYDAPSIFQVTGGNTAGVSVRSSSQAFKDCSTDRDYINSFKKIIICFDNDEPGQKAARQVSSLFDFNKVYHVKFNKHKDANDYLQNSEGPDLYTAWKGARRYSPDNIISQFGQIEDTLNEVKEDKIGEYPFKSLNQHLYGIHKGEIIVIKAGSWAPGKSSSGVGKSEVFRAIEHHLLKTTRNKLALIHLEEDNATTIKAIAGYELGQPAVLPDSGLSAKDIFEGYKKAVGDDDTRVHIYSSFELEDEAIFLDNLRFLGTAAGCSIFFLDHITWLGTGLEQEDERRKLDRLSQKLKLLAKELRIAIVMISHTNDEGRTRGSRNIENVANTIIHLTRDKDSPDPVVRNTVHISVEKARLGGRAGPAGKAYFDPYTNVLREFQQEDLIPERSLTPA